MMHIHWSRFRYIGHSRPWHWRVRSYPGVNGVTTTLRVWGYWAIETERIGWLSASDIESLRIVADEVSRIHMAFDRGDNRKDDVRHLAARLRVILAKLDLSCS